MLFKAREFRARITKGASRFILESASAGVPAKYLLGARRRVGPDTLPTGLQLHPDRIFEPILKIGAPENGATIEAPVSGLAPRNGANRKR